MYFVCYACRRVDDSALLFAAFQFLCARLFGVVIIVVGFSELVHFADTKHAAIIGRIQHNEC